jgi:hypothetical protein
MKPFASDRSVSAFPSLVEVPFSQRRQRARLYGVLRRDPASRDCASAEGLSLSGGQIGYRSGPSKSVDRAVMCDVYPRH